MTSTSVGRTSVVRSRSTPPPRCDGRVWTGCDLAIVLCDGLSPRAIERYGPGLVEQIAAHERLGGWSIAPITVVRNGRVAIGDPIGELLGAGIVVVLIGERPGLTISESVGAYLTFGPTCRPDRRRAQLHQQHPRTGHRCRRRRSSHRRPRRARPDRRRHGRRPHRRRPGHRHRRADPLRCDERESRAVRSLIAGVAARLRVGRVAGTTMVDA